MQIHEVLKFLFNLLASVSPILMSASVEYVYRNFSLPLSFFNIHTCMHTSCMRTHISMGGFLVIDGYTRNYASLFWHQVTKETIENVSEKGVLLSVSVRI